MKIILLKDVQNLGKIGNTVTVKSGYARNYLIPYGMAIFSNLDNIAVLQTQKQEIQLKKNIDIKNAQLRILKIKNINPITIFSKSKDTGQLFGSISIKDIVNSIRKLGIHIEKHEIVMKSSLIRKIGNYHIVFQPYKDISCYILVKIISQN